MIVDDGGYGMLRYDQDVAGADRYGVDLLTPDFDALAARVRDPRAARSTGLDDEFGEALAAPRRGRRSRACSSPRTPEPLVPPPNTSPNWYRRSH